MEFDGNKNQTTSGETSGVQSVGAFIWDMVKILIMALVIIVPFRMFIAEPFVVSGSSMLPTYHNRDYLIINRISYRFSPPQRGDVIVLKFPKDPTQFFIKRVIGLPGETVQLKQGHVVITNSEHPEGMVLKEPYLSNQNESLGRTEPQKLGSEEYYVLGDNRTASSDSRVWGVLPKTHIVGKVWVRVFPLSRSSMFEAPNYQ